MTIKHLVLVRFKADAGAEIVNESCSRMVGLKDGCVHPTSQKQYIKSVSGGKDNSEEGRQDGITHAFVMEFDSLEDRDYYTNSDPVHDKFKAFVWPYIEKMIVVDYTEGLF